MLKIRIEGNKVEITLAKDVKFLFNSDIVENWQLIIQIDGFTIDIEFFAEVENVVDGLVGGYWRGEYFDECVDHTLISRDEFLDFPIYAFGKIVLAGILNELLFFIRVLWEDLGTIKLFLN